jgi:hypothetical protein
MEVILVMGKHSDEKQAYIAFLEANLASQIERTYTKSPARAKKVEGMGYRGLSCGFDDELNWTGGTDRQTAKKMSDIDDLLDDITSNVGVKEVYKSPMNVLEEMDADDEEGDGKEALKKKAGIDEDSDDDENTDVEDEDADEDDEKEDEDEDEPKNKSGKKDKKTDDVLDVDKELDESTFSGLDRTQAEIISNIIYEMNSIDSQSDTLLEGDDYTDDEYMDYDE